MYKPDDFTKIMIFVQLSSNMLVYQRKSYNILDMLGELGGFLKMVLLLAQILVAGYGLTNYRVHMVVSLFARRDRTLTLARHLWEKPLSKHTISTLAFQLQTGKVTTSNISGCRNFILSMFRNNV